MYMSTTGNAGEQYFENLFNPNTGADALQDIEDFTEFMETFDTVTTGHVLLKQSEDPREFGGIAKATASTASTLVERGSDGSVTADTIVIDDTTYAATIDTATLSAARTLTIPDETGTVVTSVNTDFVANNTQRTNINALTDNEFIQKTGTNTFSSKAATSTYSASDSNLVERESGKIKTNTLNVGADGGSSELNVNASAASASVIATNNPTLNLIRNGGGSDNFGGDSASDWRFQNDFGNLFIERGKSSLTNAYATILSFSSTNRIDINPIRTGQEIETIPLRMYRQISGGTANNDYIDLKPGSISGQHTQLFPDLDGTFILDSTTEYVGLNTLRNNYNARTTGTLIKKDSGDDAVGEEAFAEANTASTIVKRTSSNQINATNFVAPTGGNLYINDFRLHQFAGSNYVDYNGPVNFRVGGTSTNFVLNTSGYTWSMTGTGRISGTTAKLSFGSDAALEVDAAGVTAGRFVVRTDGLVGINTAAPTTLLDVNGTANLAGNTSVGGTLDVTGETQINANTFLYDHFGHAHSHLIEGRLDIHNVAEAIAIHADSSETSGRISFTTDADGGAKRCFTIESQYTDDLFAFCYDQNAVPAYSSDAVMTLGGTTSGGGHLKLKYDGGQVSVTKGSNTASIGSNTLTADRTVLLPDADGTIALTSDAPWTTTGSDIYYNTGNVFIGQTSGSEALEVTGNIKSTGNVQCSELQGTLGSSTKIDLTPGGGNIDIVVPTSPGGLFPNIDINFKTGSDIRMNMNSIDGIVFHDGFIFRNDVGSTYFPLQFNPAVANQLNIGTDTVNISSGDLTLASGDLTLTSGNADIGGSLEVDGGNVHVTTGNMYIGTIPGSIPIGIQNLYVEAGTTTIGVQAHVGVAVMGNGIADYAMFSHELHHTTGNYALLQANDGETFLNCASTKQIHFRVNNSTRGGIDDETGKVRTFFIVPAATKPTYDSLGKIQGDYNSFDNITFRQFTTGGTQNERTHMYSQVVLESSTTPFSQGALQLMDYGVQPGFTSPNPGYAFRVADPNRHAQIHCSFSGYTSAANALQTVKLQMYAKKADGTNAYVDICTFDFYVNTRFEHQSFSFSKMVQFTHSYYSYARFVLVSGTFQGDTGDFFDLTIDQLPRLTR